MELKDFLYLVNKKKWVIVLAVFIFLILASIMIIIQPLKYGSSAKVLVIQNTAGADQYQMSKSNEYLSDILAQVVYSNSFFENVLSSGYFVDKNYFGQNVKDQMKMWNKTVSANAVNDSGIIAFTVYHTNRSQAELIAQAIAYTLQTKHSLYHGNGENVSIKTIDEPITSNYPVKPNVVLNFIFAFALGLVFSLVYIYLFSEEKSNSVQIPFAERQENPDSYQEPKFVPTAVAPAAQPIREIPSMPGYMVNENFNNTDLNKVYDDNSNDYDDLDIREEIAKQGSMKNIFGKPYSDDL